VLLYRTKKTRSAVESESYPKPVLRETDSAQRRLGGLYLNRQDPALFVPRRNGPGWTLNFGRPQALVLFGVVLFFSIWAPLTIFQVLLGE